MRLISRMPFSLLAFPLVAILYALQMIPLIGVFMMLFGAPLWTGMLLNAGMIGLLLEVPIRHFAGSSARPFLAWIIIPIIYFGGYSIYAYNDHRTLQSLRAEYDAANAKVLVPFDEEKQSLVLAGAEKGYAGALTQDYGLSVAYTENENVTGRNLATFLADQDLCSDIRGDQLMRAAFIHAFGFHDGDRIGHRRLASGFCSVRMPATPLKPAVTAYSTQTETSVNGLPVRLVETVVTMPDDSEFILRGGTGSPYPWFPNPILGCALNSGAPSWDCLHGFSRDRFTSIVSSATKHGGDTRVLAEALGLKPTGPQGRKSVNREVVEAQLQRTVEQQLESDITDVKEAIADPAVQMTIHSVKVLQQSPDELLPLAPLLVEGIIRAAEISDNPYRNRETGKNLALLFGKLPFDVQDKYEDEMALIYKRADEANDGRHWLYEAEPLLRFRRPLASFSPSSEEN